MPKVAKEYTVNGWIVRHRGKAEFGYVPKLAWEAINPDTHQIRHFKTLLEARRGLHEKKKTQPKTWLVTWYEPGEGNQSKAYARWSDANYFAQQRTYDMIRRHAGLDTKAGAKAMLAMQTAPRNEAFHVDYKEDQVSISGGSDMAKNPKRKTTRKATPAQLRARKLFAQRAKSGAFRKTKRKATKKKTVKKNPIRRSVMTGVFGRRTRVSPKARAKISGRKTESAADRRARIMGSGAKKAAATKKWSANRKRVKSRGVTGRAATMASAFGRRRVIRRNPKTKFVIKAIRPMKTGYKYYWLRGDEFVLDAAHATKHISRAACNARMREIQSSLPQAISSIRCEQYKV